MFIVIIIFHTFSLCVTNSPVAMGASVSGQVELLVPEDVNQTTSGNVVCTVTEHYSYMLICKNSAKLEKGFCPQCVLCITTNAVNAARSHLLIFHCNCRVCG